MPRGAAVIPYDGKRGEEPPVGLQPSQVRLWKAVAAMGELADRLERQYGGDETRQRPHLTLIQGGRDA